MNIQEVSTVPMRKRIARIPLTPNVQCHNPQRMESIRIQVGRIQTKVPLSQVILMEACPAYSLKQDPNCLWRHASLVMPSEIVHIVA